MTTRTDIHAPATVDPAAYTYLDCIWLGNPEHGPDNNQNTMAAIDASTFAGNFAAKGTCDHCGARFSYGAAFRHDNGDVIVVGHICADQTFGESSRRALDFARMKDAAAYARETSHKAKAVAAILDANPGLAAALTADHHITRDINSRLVRYGQISSKQIVLVFKLAAQAIVAPVCERCGGPHKHDDCPTRDFVPIDEGRTEVIGMIVHTKWQESQYGGALKMLVVTDAGYKLWGTVPAVLADSDEPIKGKRCVFTARLEQSRKDAYFGFYKRPTCAAFVA